MFDPSFKSTKHTFVCDPNECDTLVEITTSDRFGFPSGWIHNTCPCGRQMSLISSTIEENPTIERQQMETTNTVPETYNPNLLVTYKSITNGEASYPVIKTVDLEYQLDEKRRILDKLNNLQSQVNRIIDNLSANGWYNPNTDKEEVLSELCDILGHEPKQTVRITATVNVEVDYEIPLDEVEDFDAKYFLQDNLSIDSWHGDVSVDSFDVEDADVDWN
jgi:hypothetical protein